MKLNDEQLAAVEYLEGPLLVLAGPGTGKTQLLSAKVAYILEKPTPALATSFALPLLKLAPKICATVSRL